MGKVRICLICLVLASCCAARTITVDDDGPADFSKIQDAIDDSNNGDIIIVADGIYIGAGNRDMDFGGRAITLKSENGPETCIIDCNYTGEGGFGFFSTEDSNSILDGFTIKNATSDGIFCYQGSPNITNCTITNNEGGIYIRDASPVITNCTITNNIFSGIYIYEASPIITNCKIEGNIGWDGAGIHCDFGEGDGPNLDVTITNCVIAGNYCIDDGGAISIYGYYDNLLVPPVPNLILTNSTIFGNSAGEYGGGIYSLDYRGDVVVNNCIFMGNSAGSRGNAIYVGYLLGRPQPTLTINHSNIQDGPNGIYAVGTAVNWGAGNTDTDPLFVGPGYLDWDWNWVRGDYRLRPDSPCIDAGDNNSVPADINDLDGRLRIVDGDCNETEIVDMGAYEFGWAYIGDFDGECDVDFFDHSIFALAWLTKEGDAEYNAVCDIANPPDRYINWLDLAVFFDNWLAGVE